MSLSFRFHDYRTALVALLLAAAVFAGGLLAQDSQSKVKDTEADQPLQPLRIGGNDSGGSGGEVVQGKNIGGVEVYSVPGGKSLVLRFTSTDDLSGFEDLFVSINDGEYRRIPDQVVRLQSDGFYKIQYYTVDRAGNKSSVTTRQILIDSTSPKLATTLSGTPVTKDGGVAAKARLAITGNDGPMGVGVDKILWRPGRDGEWQDYNGTIGLADHTGDGGRGVIEYKAIDRIGNETRKLVFSYYVDTIPPQMPVIRELDSANAKEGEPILLNRSGMRVPRFNEEDRLYYKIDDGNYAELKPGDTIKLPEDGEHDLTFRIVDPLGNETVKTHRIKVDVTAPTSTIRAQE